MASTSAEPRLVKPARRDELSAPRRWPRWLGGVLLLLAVLAWFAPALLVASGLTNSLVRSAAADLKGDLSIGGLSLGWLSPVRVFGVSLKDARGDTVAQLSELETEKSLWALLTGGGRVGQVTLRSPKLDLVLRPDGSNLEDVLRPLLELESEGPKKVDLTLVIKDGEATIRDAATNRSWQVAKLDATVAVPAELAQPVAINAAGEILGGANPGRLAVDARIVRPAGPNGVPLPEKAGLELLNFPLEMLEPLAARVQPGAKLAGSLTTAFTARTEGAGDERKISFDGQASTAGLALQLPAWKEPLRLQTLKAPLRGSVRGEVLSIEQLAVESDVGQVAAAGDLRLAEVAKGDWLAAVDGAPCEVAGRVDLAALARLLPGTLRVREGLVVQSGGVDWLLSGKPAAGGGYAWNGRVTTSELAAQQAGRLVRWTDPLVAEFLVRRDQQNFVVDRLECRSSFLQATGSGTLDRLSATANLDLDRLAAELGQFFDLGGAKLAGRGSARLQWQRDAQQQFTASVESKLVDFEWTRPEGMPWIERELTAGANATGRMNGVQLARIDTATATLAAAGGAATVQLAGPVDAPRAAGVWPIDLRLQGALEQWQPRLALFVPLGDWSLAGQCDLKAQALVGPGDVQLPELELSVQRLQAVSATRFISEPELRVTASGKLQRDPLQLTISNADINSSALQARAKDLRYQTVAGAPQLHGALDYQGDLGKMNAWLRSPQAPAKVAYAGRLTGQLRGESSGDQSTIELQSMIDNLTVASTAPAASGANAAPLWREPRVSLTARLVHDRAADALKLTAVDLASGMLQLNAAGQLTELTTRRVVELNGKMNYDLAQLSRVLEPYWGSDLQLVGREARNFQVRGPLAEATVASGPVGGWRQLDGAASFGWERANLLGLAVGPANFEVSMGRGMVQLKPVDLVVAQGRVLLSPRVRLSPEPAELLLDKGPVVQQVQLTEEICAGLLKYAAPALAGAAVAQGQLSVDLEGGRLPLADLGGGELSGRLTIHAAQVRAGPVMQEMIWLARQIEALLRKQQLPDAGNLNQPLVKVSDNSVPFQLKDRRVYHEGLEIQVGEVTVRTRGSVGLDQSLALVAEVPIRSDWLKQAPRLAGLKNQTIRIPIAGTLNQPQLDRNAWQNLATQFLQGAVQELLRGEVERGLDRLLRPRGQ
ncbi:MAG: hypothetical protein U0836_04120 [Pirellulales bacterium]